MLIVGLVVAIPVTIVVRGEDEPPEPEAISADLPELGPTEYDRNLGVELQLPPGWKSDRRGKALILESDDGRARVALSSPGPARDAKQLHQEVLDQFKRVYEKTEIEVRMQPSRIGGLSGRTTTVRAKPKGSGQELGIFVSTAKGDKLAYLVVTHTPAVDPGQSTIEAQALLNELEFVG